MTNQFNNSNGTNIMMEENTMNRNHESMMIARSSAGIGAKAVESGDIAYQLQQIRPTIFIWLGGTGQLIGTHIKARLLRTFGAAYREKIALIGFDSTEEPFAALVNDEQVVLEPGAEFFNIGQVPMGRIKANIDRHHAIRERLGNHIDRLPSVMRGNGMKMIRPAALAAYYWHYPLIHQELSKAIWRLAGRDVLGAQEIDRQQGINIYIAGSLVGGTGSGLFLDMAYHVRSLLADLGMQSEYCTITGLGVLAQAFRGINGHSLYANGGAALRELTHLMLHEDFEARYPNGRVVAVQEAPFNLFYVLDGVDERGRTWNGIQEVAAMAADGLFLQMASQVGKRGENAFDNVDEILIGRTREGEPTFLSSFGLGYLEFDAPGVADLFTFWLAHELAETQWLRPINDELSGRAVVDRLHPLHPAQLTTALRTDPETGGEIYIDMRVPSWFMDKRHDVIATEAAQYIRAYGRVRIGEEMAAQINRNGQIAVERARTGWDEWLSGVIFAPEYSFHTVAGALKQAQTTLIEYIATGQRRLAELDADVEGLTGGLGQTEKNLVQAAGGLPIGRSGRIRQALAAYFQAAEALFDLQLKQAEARGRLLVWNNVAQHLGTRHRSIRLAADRISAIDEQLQQEADGRLRRLKISGGSRLSLADEDYLRQLYVRAHPGETSLPAIAGSSDAVPGVLQLDGDELQEQILRRLERSFDAVRQMTIEDVLRERAREMSPKARRNQVFQLATPSWSIDHTRLPDGGASLERLEILGVTDETETLFKDDMSRVSTHDPHRIIAYVMVAGAAPSALQQYEQYRQELDRMRGTLPVHVLPVFMTETNQGQLAFALGSIFQIIYSEGTYFYYRPSDDLQERVRLGQGLANVIDYTGSQEILVREILERVDGRIAQLGLQRAIEILAEYYSAVPEGKTRLDTITRELTRQVRAFADELQQIREFSGGLKA